MTQYLACSFSAGGRRYTYVNDLDPVAVGDVVKVPVRGAPDAWQRVIVEEVVEKPKFQCVAILGVAETAAERAARKAEGAEA